VAQPDSLAALRIPTVRRFAVGRIVSVLGAQMLSVAIGWQLYDRTGSAWSLGLVGLVQIVPVVLLALPAGQAADKYPRRFLAMGAHGVLAICATSLALVTHLARDGALVVDPADEITGAMLVVHGGKVVAHPLT